MIVTLKWLTDHDASTESIYYVIRQGIIDQEAPGFVRSLIKNDKMEWADSTIYKILAREGRGKYAVYAAEQVFPLWKDKYPKEAAVWRKWVDDGCPRAAPCAVTHTSVLSAIRAIPVIAATRAAADAALYAAACLSVAAVQCALSAAIRAYGAEGKKELHLTILNYGISLLENKDKL